MLNLRVRKKGVPNGAPFLFGRPMPKDSGADLSKLRRRISELVERNAVTMVQNAIDAVNEGGQYQAMKYLFELIGLFPASVNEGPTEQDSLTGVLLEALGIHEGTEAQDAKKLTGRPPVKSE